MDVKKLIDAALASGVPELLLAGHQVAVNLTELVALLKANHERAKAALDGATEEQLDAIHAETLRAIDAFDAELAAAAQR